MSVISCAGPGDECEIGGPNDGQIVEWDRKSTIRQTVYTTPERKEMYLNEVYTAFKENTLDKLIANPEYEFLFSLSPDKKALIEKLFDKTYKICLAGEDGFLVYSGDISKAPEIVYETIIVVKEDK